MSYPDEPQDEQGGEYQSPAYLNQTQFSRPRPANGGDLAGSNGGGYPAAGPAHLLAASRPPQLSKPDGGGTTYFAASASPGQDAGGAFASMSSPTFGQTRPNAGGPNVTPQQYSPFGNYAPHQAPRPAALPTGSPEITTPRQGQALDMFMEQHAARQASQGGGQQGQQQGGQQAEDEAERGAAEGEAAGAEAGAAEGAAEGGAGIGSMAELLGLI